MTATSEQELLLIGETWAPAIAGSVRDVLDPASGEVIAQVADASRADVDAAVAQARAVFDAGAWPGMPGAQRARILWRVADLIEEHADELARLETRDQGQPLSISAGFSVPMAAEVFRPPGRRQPAAAARQRSMSATVALANPSPWPVDGARTRSPTGLHG